MIIYASRKCNNNNALFEAVNLHLEEVATLIRKHKPRAITNTLDLKQQLYALPSSSDGGATADELERYGAEVYVGICEHGHAGGSTSLHLRESVSSGWSCEAVMRIDGVIWRMA